MRNLLVLGASALVLALGVAQASAPTTPQWQEHLDRMHHGDSPSTDGDLRDFRAQAAEQGCSHPTPAAALARPDPAAGDRPSPRAGRSRPAPGISSEETSKRRFDNDAALP